MNIETKEVRDTKSDYTKFGWSYTGTTTRHGSRIKHTEYIIARDLEMPNYRLLAALENKYFALQSQIKHYQPIDGGTCFLAFLCLIIPGILYVVFKSMQKSSIEAHNAPIEKQMRDIVAEAKKYL